jgi:hypothetical protein
MSRSSIAAVWTTVLPIALVASGCSSGIKVETDFSPASKFTEYRTYAFADVPAAAAEQNTLDAIATEHVRMALDSTLPGRGLQKASNPDEADLLVYTWGSKKERMDVTDWGYSYGGYRWAGTYASNTSVTYYNEGTLVVDMIDPKKKQLVWRGTATATVNDRKDAQRKIPQAVVEMTKQYPPKPPS